MNPPKPHSYTSLPLQSISWGSLFAVTIIVANLVSPFILNCNSAVDPNTLDLDFYVNGGINPMDYPKFAH